MATFVIPIHPITILVTDFTNPDNLTNDLLILQSLKVDCDTFLLQGALKQSDIRIKCDDKIQPSVLYLKYKGTFSE